MRNLKLVFTLATALWAHSVLMGQSSSASAVEITGITMFDGSSSPQLTSHCLNAVAPQTSNSCGGAMTDVSWFRFTLPLQAGGSDLATASVRIQVVPTGFDALVEFFTGTAASPTFRECVNATAAGATEILRTNPNAPVSNVISVGVEYYIRVSSVTDIASGCFTIGLQYYPGVHVRNGQHPVPNPDPGLPGFGFPSQIPRNIAQNGTGAIINTAVQATRFRFVDVNTPQAAGCTAEVNGTISFVTANQVPCICYGNSYLVYVQARYEGHWSGETLVRTIMMEAEPIVSITSSSSGALDNNCRAINSSGFVQAQALSPMAVYEWEWCTPGIACTYVTGTPGTTQCYLHLVPCLKFGRTYTVRVRVNLCGILGSWSNPRCITVPSMPYAQVTNCPTSNVGNGTVLFANFIAGVNQYAWLFAPVNPAAPLIPIGPAIVVISSGGTPNSLLLGPANIPNGTYRVQVKPRSTTCGIIQEGDYSVWCIITKGPQVQGMALLDDEPAATFDSVIESRELDYYDYVAGRPLEFVELTERNGPELTFRILSSGQAGSGTITFLNTAGQLVSQIPVILEEGDPLVRVQTKSLASGLYIARYEGDHGSGATKIYLE